MNFWSQFPRALCLPDNCGCEFIDLNAWIAQSSAFWSSFFYLIFAYFFFISVSVKDQKFKLWLLSLILLSVGSFFAHASFLEIAMAVDFAGIILVMSFHALYKRRPSFLSSFLIQVILLFVYFISLAYVFYALNKWIKIGLCVLVLLFVLLDLSRDAGVSVLKNKFFQAALFTLSLGFISFMFDELKMICSPHSWLSGHSLWHLGTAMSLYFYGRFKFQRT